ncbi:flagellar hook assembly protein FlgD [Neobacillus rhizophilus]|uniref:Flagellar hook assembly protein FlgD n=1 Tax=Neobacillus rhizophilus TaxID=2833579 RepID=A0A942U7T0_9BACI|nr:flagellar hook assembly protein FlgD [Neobacillus rhizophilus]MBS4213034.1 flagellar hook assembly protein FlgD [Neobacillus rhizophilus]
MTSVNTTTPFSNSLSTKQTNHATNSLGKDAFLKLLTTQLQNQDPTQPMEDREFISQLAQFSTLEQMSNLNQAFAQFANSNTKDISYYSHMIGKEASWLNPEIGQQDSGIVNGVIKKGSQFFYQLNDQEIPVDSIISAKIQN